MKSKTIKYDEKSCGAVTYTIKNNVYYFLIEQMNMGHYSLPKGHVEINETEIETALREIKEETNLNVTIDETFKEETIYKVKKHKTKQVVFFLAYFKDENNIIRQEKEVKQILLLPFNEAYKILTYQNDKDILLKAYLYILKAKVNRIILIGCPGSGKSYLSKHLRNYTNLPLYHLDKLFWYGDWQHVTSEELKEKVESIIKNDKWIIDGNYNKTIKQRMEACDLIVHFNMRVDTCLKNVEYRIKYNNLRDDMPESCKETQMDEDFKEYIIGFRKTHHKKNENLINNISKNILTIKSRKFLQKIIEIIDKKQ